MSNFRVVVEAVKKSTDLSETEVVWNCDSLIDGMNKCRFNNDDYIIIKAEVDKKDIDKINPSNVNFSEHNKVDIEKCLNAMSNKTINNPEEAIGLLMIKFKLSKEDAERYYHGYCGDREFSDRLMKCFDSVYNEQRYLDKAYDIISQIVKQLKKDYTKLGLEIKSNNLSKHTGSINIGKHHVYTKSDPRHGSITYYGTDLIVSIEYTIQFDDNIVFDVYRVDKKPVKNLGNVSIPFPKSGHVEPYWYGKLRDLVNKALS